MDTAQIKLSKAAATHTETSWAQAYNAGKLYIVLSVTTEEKGVAALGKDTLEKLQREFFALDDKNLESIKKAVTNVTTSLPEGTTHSLILATPVDDTLYLILSGQGEAYLKRDEKIVGIAKGEENQAIGFSGKVASHDSFILTTHGMTTTVPFSDISKALTAESSEEISESLAPLLSENTTGEEAILVLQFPETATASPAGATSALTEEPTEENSLHAESEEKNKLAILERIPKFQMPKVNIETLRNLSRKQIAIILVVVLLLILGGGIFIEHNRRTNSELDARLEQVLSTNKQAYEDAQAILSLNRSLAVEELRVVRDNVEKELATFPKSSSQYKELEAFLNQVNEIINGEGGTAVKPEVFFEGDDDVSNPEYMTVKGGEIVVVGSNAIGILSDEGEVDDSFESPASGQVSANEENVYVWSNGSIYRISKSNGSDTEIIENISGIKSFDVFGNNVYALTDTILRFRANNFDEENYTEVSLSKPTSLSIDSSIWVIDSGKIRKFTRGAEDAFSVSGNLPLSQDAVIYTDEEYDNLYVLDPQKQFISVISKNGDIVKNLELTGMKNITSFAADEEASKIYIVAGNKVYSVDF